MKGAYPETSTGYRVPANARKAEFGPAHDRKLPFGFMAVRHPLPPSRTRSNSRTSQSRCHAQQAARRLLRVS
jgi:hypothetical protein